MAEKTLTKLVGEIVSMTNPNDGKNSKYEIVLVEKESNRRISVTYPRYNPMIWESIRKRNDKQDEDYLERCFDWATVLIKGKIDRTRTDYEGVGIIEQNS